MEKKIVLEIGSSDGYDTTRLRDKFGLPVYGFEPVPQNFTHLNKIMEKDKDVHIFEMAVDIEDGEKDFYLSDPYGSNGKFTDGTNRPIHPYGCSSLYEFSDDIHDKWQGRPDFNMVETIKVKTKRLDTFLSENNFDGEIEYMHCDAQGNDVKVLESMGDYIRCIKQGKIEVAAQTELYKGTNNNIQSAKSFLIKKGFIVSGFSARGHETDVKFTRGM